MLLLYGLTLKNETLSVPLHNNTENGQNSTKKARNLPVHIVELSTAVVKVDIKVINASLTQNQCLTPFLMHVEIPRQRDATELNNDGMIKSGDVYYQTEPILSVFFRRRFSQRQL